MYKQCKTEQSAKRQREFGTTLLAMMKQTPYQKISVSALCREMQVQRKTFYRYFDGIEDVLNVILDEVIDEAFLFLLGEPELEQFFAYWQSQAELLDILGKNHITGSLFNRMGEYIFINKKEVTLTDLNIVSYIASFMAIVRVWHNGGMTQSPKELADMIKRTYITNR